MASSSRLSDGKNETDSSISSFVTSFIDRKSDRDRDNERESEMREVYKDQLSANGYHLRHRLGRGGYGVVYLCCHSASKTRRAVKIMMSRSKPTQYLELDMNVEIKEKLDRTAEANIPPSVETKRAGLCLLIDHFTIDTPLGACLCIVYPLLGRPVCSLRSTISCLPVPQERIGLIQQVSLSVTQALAKLHKIGVCHADFRSSNILFDYGPDNFGVNIIDIGQAFDASSLPGRPTHRVIPISYAAPEIVCCNTPSPSLKVDIWSLACTLWELRCGSMPFSISSDPPKVIQWELCLDETVSLLGWPDDLDIPEPEDWATSDSDESEVHSVEMEEEGVLTTDERRRRLRDAIEAQVYPRFSEAESADFADLLEQLWRWNLVERPTSEAAAKHAWFSTSYE